MRRSSYKSLEAEAGLTLLEVVAAVSISVLAFASIHLTVGTAILGKLLASSTVSKEQQGRQAVEWIADRVRQAGFRASATSTFTRCRNGIVSQDASYYPTTSKLSVTGDVDNDGTAETRTFQIETVNGVPAVTETVLECATGATPLDQPITSPTTVKALALQFDYYDAIGNPVANLTSPTEIQKIRYVQVTIQVQASAGAHGPTTQTWTSNIALRNP